MFLPNLKIGKATISMRFFKLKPAKFIMHIFFYFILATKTHSDLSFKDDCMEVHYIPVFKSSQNSNILRNSKDLVVEHGKFSLIGCSYLGIKLYNYEFMF